MRYIILISLLHICMSGIGQQGKRISVTVISAETGELVTGATVSFNNSHSPIFTNTAGKFEIETTPGLIVNISHAEFKTYVLSCDTIRSSSTAVYLRSNQKTLASVIVNTGYRKIDPGKTTGSYISVDSNVISRSIGPDILSRLDGLIPSLYFDKRDNSKAPLQIRGISTLAYASTMPLIILNNFPFEGDISDINPEDVENVTVLRDAAAYAIWGARAGNGVIVITTKQGKFNKGPDVTFSSGLRITPKQNLFERNSISPRDFITVERYLFDNGFYQDMFYPGNYLPVSPVVQILENAKNGFITLDEANKQIDILANDDIRGDLSKYTLHNGVLQQYALSVAGGGAKMTNYASIGFSKELSNKVGNKNHRITADLSSVFKLSNRLEINTEILLSAQQSQLNNSINPFDMLIPGTGTYVPPYSRLADNNGNSLPIDGYFRKSYIDTAGNGKLLDWRYMPLEEINYTNNHTTNINWTASAGLTYRFTRDLNLQLKYQHQSARIENKNQRARESFEARNLVNMLSQIEDDKVKYVINPGGILDTRFASSESDNARAQLNFDKRLSPKGQFSVAAGGEIRSTSINSFSDRVYGFDDNLNFTPVDYVHAYPSYNDIYGDMYIPMATGLSREKENFVSAFFIADYNYTDLFSLSASARYDASNLFGVAANRKGVPLWSAGGALTLSSLKRYKLKWLPLLRARMTYGYGGNVSHSVPALTTLSFGRAVDQRVTNLPYAYINSYPNPDLQWEKVATTNLGLDFGTRKERISGSLDFYKKMSYGVLYPKDMDPTLGTSTLVYNSATLKSTGLDLSVNTENIRQSNFIWKSSLNFSYVKTKIAKIFYSNVITKGFVNDGLNLMPIEGFEPFQIVSFPWAGLDKSGNPQGIFDGKASVLYDSLLNQPLSKQVLNGSATPHVFGNFRNDIAIFNVTFSFNINFKLGYYFRKPSLDYYDLFYRGTGTSDFERRWQTAGDETRTNVPVMVYPYDSKREKFYRYAEVNALRGDYIKLQDLRLTYAPFKNTVKMLKTLSLYGMVSNLNIILWKANSKGIDPDYPRGRTDGPVYTFGLNFNY